MEIIATRSLKYSTKGEPGRRHDLTVCIYAPFPVVKGSVAFEVDEQVAGCRWELMGLPEKIGDVAYGADSLQALQLATDVDAVMRKLSAKYDLWFLDGEPYFED